MEIKENKNKIAYNLKNLLEIKLFNTYQNTEIKFYPALYKKSWFGKPNLTREEGYYDNWDDKYSEEEITELNCYILNKIVYFKPRLVLLFKNDVKYCYIADSYEEVLESFNELFLNPIVKENFFALNFTNSSSNKTTFITKWVEV